MRNVQRGVASNEFQEFQVLTCWFSNLVAFSYSKIKEQQS